jgi:hypothetical protein
MKIYTQNPTPKLTISIKIYQLLLFRYEQKNNSIIQIFLRIQKPAKSILEILEITQTLDVKKQNIN